MGELMIDHVKSTEWHRIKVSAVVGFFFCF